MQRALSKRKKADRKPVKSRSSTKTKSDPSQVDYSVRTKANIFEYTGLSGSDAEFLGWQETVSGELVPLYIITVADHPSYHSTVGESTLRKLCLRIPRTMLPQVHVKLDRTSKIESGLILGRKKSLNA